MAKLKVTWVRSKIGCQEEHRKTLKALGFKKMNQTRIFDDTLPVRGMLEHVNFLVSVEEVAK